MLNLIMTSEDEDLHKSNGDSQPHFSAILTPYRSLSPKGFLIIMCFIGGVSFIAGVGFLLNGAWPVVGFLGIDVLLVYLAFKMSYRSGQVYETVDLTEDDLIVTRYDPRAQPVQWRFNPYWVRLTVEVSQQKASRMVLSCHENTLEFGRFLLDDEKVDFAKALKDALFEYRGGVRI